MLFNVRHRQRVRQYHSLQYAMNMHHGYRGEPFYHCIVMLCKGGMRPGLSVEYFRGVTFAQMMLSLSYLKFVCV